MNNNKGMSFVFVSFVMLLVLAFLITVWSMGMNEFNLSKEFNERSKAYYLAEAGIYYARAAAKKGPLQVTPDTQTITSPAVPADIGPFYNVDDPDTGYKKAHGFVLNVTVDGGTGNYIVKSIGQYNGKEAEVQAEITADGNTISGMKKITDINLK